MFIGIDELLKCFLTGKNILLVCCNSQCRRHNIEALKFRVKENKSIIYKPSFLECLKYKKAIFAISLNDRLSIEYIAGMEFNIVADCGAIEHLNPQFLNRQR